MNESKTIFSEWKKWKDHLTQDKRRFDATDAFEDALNPGIYLLARFDSEIPSGHANPSDKNIVYIGETGNSLATRLNAFHFSAFVAAEGTLINHSGGKTYYKKYKQHLTSNESGVFIDNKLYVAICSINKDEKFHHAFIQYLERKLLWDFAQTNEKLPDCNSK